MKHLLSVFFLLGGALFAGPILYTIGPNANGLPNQLVRIDVDAGTVSTLITIGGPTRNFGGGLVGGNSNLFGGFETTAAATTFALFDLSGSLGFLISRPAFQGGGLTFGPGNPQPIFWIENDVLGNSNLLGTIFPAASLGTGFNGGLAFRDVDFTLYALRNTAGGSTLQAFAPFGQNITQLPIVLGSGFTGGLAWDPASDLFYALGSDANKNTTLYRFAANDATPTALFGIGQGFEFAALTIGTAAASPSGQSQVPEPGTWLMTSAGVLALLALRWKR
ncbi:MAG: PEP-CTERM sorting domain-containing protein [Acidobacteria bacterium]|nr:PEP-CTERM sorting domain-containing protein [Acidobacteriota bacterium]